MQSTQKTNQEYIAQKCTEQCTLKFRASLHLRTKLSSIRSCFQGVTRHNIAFPIIYFLSLKLNSICHLLVIEEQLTLHVTLGRATSFSGKFLEIWTWCDIVGTSSCWALRKWSAVQLPLIFYIHPHFSFGQEMCLCKKKLFSHVFRKLNSFITWVVH